jgi:hypothetical protein
MVPAGQGADEIVGVVLERRSRYTLPIPLKTAVLFILGMLDRLTDLAQCLTYMRGTRLETCLLVKFGRAKSQVRRLGMNRVPTTGEVELDVKDVK